jgi:hypothetical protein
LKEVVFFLPENTRLFFRLSALIATNYTELDSRTVLRGYSRQLENQAGTFMRIISAEAAPCMASASHCCRNKRFRTVKRAGAKYILRLVDPTPRGSLIDYLLIYVTVWNREAAFRTRTKPKFG